MKVVSSIGKSLNIGEGRARCNAMACIGLITCISNHDNYNYDL